MPGRAAETEQDVMTVLTPIRAGRAPELATFLATIVPPGSTSEAEGPVPFEALDSVHFLRWVVLDEALDARGVSIAPELVMASCFDGTLDDHLHELVRVAREGLDRIYGYCDGYPAPGATPEDVVAYLRAHIVPSAATYVGARRHSRDRIEKEGKLRIALENVIDAQTDGVTSVSADAVARALRTYVETTPALAWALEPPLLPPARWYLQHYGRLALLVAVALLLLPFLLPAILVLRILLQRAQAGEGVPRRGLEGRLPPLKPAPIEIDSAAALAHVDRLANEEDFEVQNQMTLVSPIKPGRLRLFALRAVCWVIQQRATYFDTTGTLGGIPSIHFAHWVVIDDGRRLLFCSNYDGTWESYLGEFIDRAASALTAIWSNCIEFPRTRYLVIGGARDEQRFKQWIRRCQVFTDVWYAAYPRWSMQNVLNSSAIREGLGVPLEDDERAAWLRRF